jgi:hypothetical protein
MTNCNRYCNGEYNVNTDWAAEPYVLPIGSPS